MPSTPSLSVVLATLDRASVLPAAIDSVLDQTLACDELVVVDGGSTDGTMQILDAVDDPRLRVVHQTDTEGVSAARNVGIAATEGELVAFIDADDTWRADKLERQVAALETAGGDHGVAYCGLSKDEGEPRTRAGASGHIHEAVRAMDVPTYTSTLLVRREALEAVGGFDEALACFEDWDLCLRLAETWAFTFVDAPLVAKGTDGDNISADPDRLAQATDRLQAKHELPASTLARLLADVGRTYCEAGNLHRGRSYLRRALDRDPDRPMATLALGAAVTGSTRVYEAAMDAAYAWQRFRQRRPG